MAVSCRRWTASRTLRSASSVVPWGLPDRTRSCGGTAPAWWRGGAGTPGAAPPGSRTRSAGHDLDAHVGGLGGRMPHDEAQVLDVAARRIHESRRKRRRKSALAPPNQPGSAANQHSTSRFKPARSSRGPNVAEPPSVEASCTLSCDWPPERRTGSARHRVTRWAVPAQVLGDEGEGEVDAGGRRRPSSRRRRRGRRCARARR